MKRIIYILLFLPFVTSCTQSSMSERLAKIDSLVVSEKYDSAFSVLSEIDNTLIVNSEDKAHYTLLSTQIGYLVNKPPQSDSILDLAISYYEQNRNKSKLSDCYYYKSNRDMYEGNYPNAILLAKMAEQNAQGICQKYKTSERLAFLNELCGNYMLQLEYARKALKISFQSQNKNWIAYSYHNIATAFSNLDNFDSARYYINKTTPYIIYVDKKNKAGFLANIGVFFKDQFPEKAR
ncbi:MAG: hypothetical protein J5682_05465, partial [Prevotella sp.]|nr:hypothetical protein [Prevotella sp.]